MPCISREFQIFIIASSPQRENKVFGTAERERKAINCPWPRLSTALQFVHSDAYVPSQVVCGAPSSKILSLSENVQWPKIFSLVFGSWQLASYRDCVCVRQRTQNNNNNFWPNFSFKYWFTIRAEFKLPKFNKMVNNNFGWRNMYVFERLHAENPKTLPGAITK